MRRLFILLVVVMLAGCASHSQRLEISSGNGKSWVHIVGTDIKLPLPKKFSAAKPEQGLFVIHGKDGSTHALMAVARHEYDNIVFDEMKTNQRLLKTTGESYCSMGQPMRLDSCSILDNGVVLFRCTRQFPSNSKSIALFSSPSNEKCRIYAVGYLHISGSSPSQDLSFIFQRMVERATSK
ncbi:hypothetical protein [Desulfocurvus sp. DL9XJH121]